MAKERHESFPAWHVTCIAALYACLGSVCAIRYLCLDLAMPGVHVPAPVQIACFLAAASGIAYFFKPRLGHHGLILVTGLALYLAATGHDARAIGFHILILALLSIPLITKSPGGTISQAGTAS
jgi:hypothetical protein